MGMTAHWIEVKGGVWKSRSEVVALKFISGNHTGENIGKYFMALTDRVGITSKERSKVSYLDWIVGRSTQTYVQFNMFPISSLR